jgi:phosphoribosylformimino-5-aminoimidazole carboxamide ribonucleotide (ProFAR) isomerase
MQHLAKIETHQRLYYKAKCVGANLVMMTMECESAIAMGGGVRHRTTANLSEQASCYTVVVVTTCSLQ